MLRAGGTAADAAVAAAAMLCLVEPYSHGLGGDTFVLYYSAEHRKLFGLNSSGTAPAAWSPEYFAARGHDKESGMPSKGVDTITVPGAVAGWDALLRRFGKKNFREAFEPAAIAAEQGFGVTERIQLDWDKSSGAIRDDPDASQALLVNGEAPDRYQIFRNPGLARALRLLQRRGRDAFYDGDIGAAIIRKINDGGGAMTWQDLNEFHPEWVDPISVNYHGYDVYQVPPNTQGFAALEMLNILEACPQELGMDIRELGPRSPEYWHLLIEAKKLAYSDLHAYNGDPRFVDVPLDRLLSKEYAAELCRSIDRDHAMDPTVTGNMGGGTVYITVADRWGNMASFISSIYQYFGSGIGVPGFGFPLHNRGALFSLDKSHPNSVAPKKRPFQTIIPAFVMANGTPVASFGNMGGDIQAQAQVQEIVNLVDFNMNVQAAGDAARFRHNQESNITLMESNLYDVVGAALSEKGHNIESSSGEPMGGYQAIMFQPEADDSQISSSGVGGIQPVSGIYRAGTDHRKDGTAMGW